MADKGLFGTGRTNLDDAAYAALYLLQNQPRVHQQEYMGLIVQGPDGKYYRTGFQTDGQRLSSSWTGVPGGPVKGIVHSHPEPSPGQKYPGTHFSDTDVSNSVQFKEPNYIVVADRKYPGAQLTRRFRPGQTETYNPGSNRDSHKRHSEGEEFLAEFPIDEMKMVIAQRIKQSSMSPSIKARLLQNLMVPQMSSIP